ncbi:MAG: glycosyltransferase [Steroidobacteraceae bacterium]
MKVLVVASTFPARDGEPVPSFVRDQILAMKACDARASFSVLAPHDPGSRAPLPRHPQFEQHRFHYFWPRSAERLTGRGILPTLRGNPLFYLLVPFLFAGEFLALWSLTRRERPEVIYAHWFTPQAVVAWWVSGLTGTPFVFTSHSSDVEVWRRIPVVGPRTVRAVVRSAAAFTAVSQRTMDRIRGFFTATEWVEIGTHGAVVPMGVHLPPAAAAQDTGPAAARCLVLFMGRLVEKKGVRFLLAAYARARDRMPGSRLVVAGDGPLLDELRGQAASLDLGDQVEFVGHVGGEQKAALLRQADVHVVPSIVSSTGDVEGLPVSLLEGLAWGKVCIATPQGGADEILETGRDGFLVPGADVEALAARLVEAFALAPGPRAAMQGAARRKAQEFEWSVVARRQLELLRAAARQE